METINWKNLVVVDCEGDAWGELGDIVENAPANLDSADIVDGKIEAWHGFFLEAPSGGNIDDVDFHGVIDWTGFSDRLDQSRGENDE